MEIADPKVSASKRTIAQQQQQPRLVQMRQMKVQSISSRGVLDTGDKSYRTFFLGQDK